MSESEHKNIALFIVLVVVVLVGALGLGALAGDRSGRKAAEQCIDSMAERDDAIEQAVKANTAGVASLNEKLRDVTPADVLREVKAMRAEMQQK